MSITGVTIGCPWCGEQDKLRHNGTFISCLVCGSNGPLKRKAEDTLIAWNTRLPLESIQVVPEAPKRTRLKDAVTTVTPTPFVLVVPCTSVKTQLPNIEACLSSFKPNTQEELEQAWIKTIAAQEPISTARNLYAGKSVRLLASLALANDFDMFIVSTGLGLTHAADPIPAYDLSLTGGNSSLQYKVIGKLNIPKWWDAIRKGLKRKSLSELFHDSGNLVVLALSGDYLELLSDELNELTDEQIKRLRIIGNKDSLPPKLQSQHLPYTSGEANKLLVAGTGYDFNYRAAYHYVTSRLLLGDVHQLGIASDIEWLNAQFTAPSKPLTSNVDADSLTADQAAGAMGTADVLARKASMSDEDVKEFIRTENLLAVSPTAALRQLRTRGFACSQQRFDRIHQEMKRYTPISNKAEPQEPSAQA